MTNVRYARSGASHLILKDGNKVLLLRRFNTGWNDGNYSLVAGHIEKGENALDAMIREASEEAGISIKKSSLKFVHICHRKKTDGEEKMDLFFECAQWSGTLHNAEPHKCDDLSWFNISDIPNNTVEYIKHVINEWNKNSTFSTFGW